MCAFLRFKLHWSSTVTSPASVVPADQFRLQSIFSLCSLRRRKPSIWAIVFCCGILGGGLWLVILLNPPTHWLLVKRHFIFYASVTSRRVYWCLLRGVLAGSQFVALLSEKWKSYKKKKRKKETGENWKAPLSCLKVLFLCNENLVVHKDKSFIFL